MNCILRVDQAGCCEGGADDSHRRVLKLINDTDEVERIDVVSKKLCFSPFIYVRRCRNCLRTLQII